MNTYYKQLIKSTNASSEVEGLVQLKAGDIKKLKEELHREQGELCPILKHWFPPEVIVVDHIHKAKRADEPGINDAGLVRGCIHTSVNIILGKVENSWKRTGLHKQDYITLPQVLRNMADYLERDALPLIHPTEKIPTKRLMKSSFNKLIKEMKAQGYDKKFPTYPSRHILTKALEKTYKKFDIVPEFY